MKFMILVLSFGLMSCQNAINLQADETKIYEVASLLNSGSNAIEMTIEDKLVINPNKDDKKWQISLGKRDFKLAIIEKYENKVQKSIQFTKIGTYQLTLASHPSRTQGAIMMQTLTIIVK